MKIVLAGYIAIEATHKLIEKEKPALSCRFSNRFLNLSYEMTRTESLSRDSIDEVISKSKLDISEEDILELSDMGIFGSLWDFAKANDTGISIDLQKISVCQETIEIFECLDINPYTYPSKGSWLIRTDKAYELIDTFEKAGITASMIGFETDNKDRVIVNQDETRFLTPVDRLLKDEQGQKNYR